MVILQAILLMITLWLAIGTICLLIFEMNCDLSQMLVEVIQQDEDSDASFCAMTDEEKNQQFSRMLAISRIVLIIFLPIAIVAVLLGLDKKQKKK